MVLVIRELFLSTKDCFKVALEIGKTRNMEKQEGNGINQRLLEQASIPKPDGVNKDIKVRVVG
jgi:hypothetical protein